MKIWCPNCLKKYGYGKPGNYKYLVNIQQKDRLELELYGKMKVMYCKYCGSELKWAWN